MKRPKLAALAKQNQARQLHDRARQLEDAYHDAASFTEKLRIQIGDTQAQLDQARKLAGQPVPPAAPAVAAQAPVQQPASQDQTKAKETGQPAGPAGLNRRAAGPDAHRRHPEQAQGQTTDDGPRTTD